MADVPSKQAFEAARRLDATGVGERSISVDRLAAALEAYAAERIEEVNEAGDAAAAFMGARVGTAERERDAALKALAEAAMELNVAGPVAHRIRIAKQEWSDHTRSVEQERNTLRERVRALEAAIRVLRDHGLLAVKNRAQAELSATGRAVLTLLDALEPAKAAAAPTTGTVARCPICGNSGWILDCRTDREPLSLELIACIYPECTHSGRAVELLSIIGPRFEWVAWHPTTKFVMSLSRGAKAAAAPSEGGKE